MAQRPHPFGVIFHWRNTLRIKKKVGKKCTYFIAVTIKVSWQAVCPLAINHKLLISNDKNTLHRRH